MTIFSVAPRVIRMNANFASRKQLSSYFTVGTVIASHPKIRVLVVLGYADAAAFAPNIPHLTKPFRVDDLVALLNHGKRQG